MTSQERLDRFDVFVSYKPEDRTAAELLSLLLWDRGIQVYMDTWYLQPGTPWIQALERIVANTRTMIVLVGAHGLGPWQKRETYIALERQLTDQNFPVIPVLLPGCNESDLPPFLRLLVWIDFREGLRNRAAIAALISAVKGESHVVSVAVSLDVLVQAPQQPRVFICHAKEDDSRIETLYYSLRDGGFDPWYDKEKLVLGDNWQDEINSAIEKTDFFAICLSTLAAKKTGFIQKEIRMAISQYQLRPHGLAFILPIKLDSCEIPDLRLDPMTTLRDLQWFDLWDDSTESYKRLVSSLRKQWEKVRTQA